MPVSMVVEPVPDLVAGRGGDRIHPGQRGEGSRRTGLPRVPLPDEHLGRGHRPDSNEVQQAGCQHANDLLQLLMVRCQLGMELKDGGGQPLGLGLASARAFPVEPSLYENSRGRASVISLYTFGSTNSRTKKTSTPYLPTPAYSRGNEPHEQSNGSVMAAEIRSLRPAHLPPVNTRPVQCTHIK